MMPLFSRQKTSARIDFLQVTQVARSKPWSALRALTHTDNTQTNGFCATLYYLFEASCSNNSIGTKKRATLLLREQQGSPDDEDQWCNEAMDAFERHCAFQSDLLAQSGSGVQSDCEGMFEFELQPYVDRRSERMGEHDYWACIAGNSQSAILWCGKAHSSSFRPPRIACQTGARGDPWFLHFVLSHGLL